MTSFQEFPCVSFVKSASDEERHIIDHVAVGQVFHELGQRACRIRLEVSELGHELFGSLIGEGRGRRVWRKGAQVVAVGGTELKLDILRMKCE